MSHTKDIVREAFKNVEEFLNRSWGEELDEKSGKNPLPLIKPIYTVVKSIARHFDIYIMRQTTFKNRYEFAWSNKMGKISSSKTLSELFENHDRFDKIYEILTDEDSKKTFDWFIKYRVAYALTGETASDIFVARIKKTDYEETENKIKKISANKYKIEKFIYNGESADIAHVFYLEDYAYSEIVKPSLGDIVIDAGAYFGDTALWFSKYVGKNGKVFAFEPLEYNFKILKNNIIENSLNDVITPVKKGIGEDEQRLNISGFGSGATTTSYESSKGEFVDITTIDKFVKANKIGRVDFIKMDIEGAELSALKGAQETLKKFKPKLAICVYHKGEDIIEIPEYLISIIPEYKLYIKHNSISFYDTVLYAV
jgi:FkbM family methyltransferase